MQMSFKVQFPVDAGSPKDLEHRYCPSDRVIEGQVCDVNNVYGSILFIALILPIFFALILPKYRLFIGNHLNRIFYLCWFMTGGQGKSQSAHQLPLEELNDL